jgi:hemolysin III
MKKRNLYSRGEEIANSITHGIGAALSLVGLIVLVVLAIRNGNSYQIISFSIFGVSLILLYLASTLYHSFQNPRLKKIFKSLDHAAIYLLIAGSYTPFLLVGDRSTLDWILMIVVWVLALVGVSFKLVFAHKFQKASVITYLFMGWLSVVAIREMLTNLPTGGVIWLAAGGVVYTVGVIFYLLKKVRYTHAIWHLFVLGGSACHYFGVLLYLAPVT